MPQLIRTKNPTARKVHLCNNCHAPAVQPGEQYERQTFVYDGQLYDWISCAECSALFGVVYDWCSDPDEGISSEQYDEWAHDAATDPTWGEQARAYLARAHPTPTRPEGAESEQGR